MELKASSQKNQFPQLCQIVFSFLSVFCFLFSQRNAALLIQLALPKEKLPMEQVQILNCDKILSTMPKNKKVLDIIMEEKALEVVLIVLV